MSLGNGTKKGWLGPHANMRHRRKFPLWYCEREPPIGNSQPLQGPWREEVLLTGQRGTSEPPNQSQALQTKARGNPPTWNIGCSTTNHLETAEVRVPAIPWPSGEHVKATEPPSWTRDLAPCCQCTVANIGWHRRNGKFWATKTIWKREWACPKMFQCTVDRRGTLGRMKW